MEYKKCKCVILSEWSIHPIKEKIEVHGLSLNYKQINTGPISSCVQPRLVTNKQNQEFSLRGHFNTCKSLPQWVNDAFENGFPSNWQNIARILCNSKSNFINVDEELSPANNTEAYRDVKHVLFKWAFHMRYNNVVVEGFVLDEKGKHQLYRTGAITDVILKTLIVTSSGSIYQLKGPICIEATVKANIPLWAAKKFDLGFPSNWKNIVAEIATVDDGNGSFNGKNKPSLDFEEEDLSSVCSYEVNGHKKELQSLKWSLFSSDSEKMQSTPKRLNLSTNVHVPDTVKKISSHIAEHLARDIDDITVSDLSLGSHNTTLIDEIKLTDKHPNGMEVNKVQNTANPKTTRTRSGRIIIPPLQHWTGQRIVHKVDKDGNEITVFYPGNESVLKDSRSPAQDVLRDDTNLLFCQGKTLNTFRPIHSPNKKHVCTQNTLNGSKTSQQCIALLTRPCSVLLSPLPVNDADVLAPAQTVLESISKDGTELTHFFAGKDNKLTKVCLKESGVTLQNPKQKDVMKMSSTNKEKNKKSNKNQKHSLFGKKKGATKRKLGKSPISTCKKINGNFHLSNQKQNCESENIYNFTNVAKKTLKGRSQVKRALSEANRNLNDQDLFSLALTSSAGNAFGQQNFMTDSTLFQPPITPSVKCVGVLGQYVTTPAWFKTPSNMGNDKYNQYLQNLTPRGCKTLKMPNKHKDMEAGKVIIKIKKGKRSSRKSSSEKQLVTTESTHKLCTRNSAKIPIGLFKQTIDQEFSSDDEYFAD